MPERNRVAKNAGIALISEFLTLLLNMLSGIIIARYLGDRGFGLYSFAMSVVWIAMVFTDLGLSTLITREIARDRSLAAQYMPAGMGLRMVSGAILTALLLALAPCMAPGPEGISALLFTAPSLILVPLGAYFMLFRASERLDLAALVQITSKTATIAAVIAAAFLGAGINGVILANLSGYIVTAVMVFLLVPRIGHRVRMNFNFTLWRKLLTRGLPFIAMSLLSEIYNRIDQIFIPFLDSIPNNGLYGVAIRIYSMFLVVASAANAAIFPYFSRRSTESIEPLRTGTRALYRHLAILGLGAAVFIGIPAAAWIKLLFGAKYAAAAPALTVLMAAVPLIFFNSIHVSVLYALEKQTAVLIFTAIGIALDIILDVILIIHIKFVGAAYATLATNALWFLFSFAIVRKQLGGISFLKQTAAPALCAAAAGACLLLCANWTIYIRIPTAAALYLTLLLATRAVTRDDISLYTSFLRGNNKNNNARA